MNICHAQVRRWIEVKGGLLSVFVLPTLSYCDLSELCSPNHH